MLGSKAERKNWLSDESAEEDKDSLPAYLHDLPEEETEVWHVLDKSADQKQREGESPRTPKANKGSFSKPSPGLHSARSHRSRGQGSLTSGDTVTQQDFWEFLGLDPTPGEAESTSEPAFPNPVQTTESFTMQSPSLHSKPLPPPPKPSADDFEEAVPMSSPSIKRRQTELSTRSVNTEVKVLWRGKKVVISVPPGPETSNSGSWTMPLTKAETLSLMKSWESQGWNISGFDVNQDEETYTGDHGAQNRALAPHECSVEWTGTDLKVFIPDQQVWDDYVNHLTEEKLRALGVTSPHEDPLSVISPSSSVTRGGTPLGPFSPAMLPVSVGGNSAAPVPTTFSPAFMFVNSTNPSSHAPSIASPASMSGPFPNSRQSFSVSSNPKSNSPYQYFPQQPSVPLGGVWSPQHLINAQGMARGGSPNLNNLSGIGNGQAFSPAPAYPLDTANIPYSNGDLFGQVRQQYQQQELQKALLQSQQESRRSSQPDEQQRVLANPHPASFAQENSLTDIATPIPGHRHNVSLSLQKEIDEAERQLESEDNAPSDEAPKSLPPKEAENEAPVESVTEKTSPAADVEETKPETREVEEPRVKAKPRISGLFASRYATAEDEAVPEVEEKPNTNAGIVASPSPMLETEDKPKSENDKPVSIPPTPSLGVAIPVGQKDTTFHQDQESQSSPVGSPSPALSIVIKPSLGSKLNVNAAEFRFDPTSSFVPSNFNFSDDSFKSNTANSNARRTVSGPLGAASKRFNAAAAPFQPSLPTRSFTQPPAVLFQAIQSTRSMTLPSSEFNFLSSGPKFNPDAPSFTPLLSKVPGSGPSPPQSLPGHLPIFDLNSITQTSDSIRLPKKTRALPIIRPSSSEYSESDNEDENAESDEDERITEPKGRQKRARQVERDGDSVPQFEVPKDSPVPDTPKAAPVEEFVEKENAAPTDSNLLPSTPQKLTINSGLKVRPRSILEESPDYDGKGWDSYGSEGDGEKMRAIAQPELSEPIEFGIYEGSGDSEQAMEELEAMRAELSMSTFLAAEDDPALSLDDPETPRAPAPKSRLSATAPTFEFSPNAPEFTPPQPPVMQTTPLKRFGSLATSRFAHSPPTSSEGSPAGSKEIERTIPNPALQATPVSGSELTSTAPELAEKTPDSEFSMISETPGTKEGSATEVSDAIGHPQSSSSIPVIAAAAMFRSDAPSPSPRKVEQDSLRRSEEALDSPVHHNAPLEAIRSSPPLQIHSPVHRLNSAGKTPVSDWDDFISPVEDAKLHYGGKVMDKRLDDVVGRLLHKRLTPLENTLGSIQQLLSAVTLQTANRGRNSRSLSAGVENSDADDEDDDVPSQKRTISPRQDPKLDKIKAIVQEALLAHGSAPHAAVHDDKMASMQQAITELKNSMAVPQQSFDMNEIKKVVEQVLVNRAPGSPRSPKSPILSDSNSVTVEGLRMRIMTLEKEVRSSEDRAIKEQASCNVAISRATKLEAQLESALEDAAHQRDIAEEKSTKLRMFDEKQHQQVTQLKLRTTVLETTHESLQKTKADLESRNSQLGIKARNAEAAAEQAKLEIDGLIQENRDLTLSVDRARLQMEESIRVLDGMQAKFAHSQSELALIRDDFAKEQNLWQKADVSQRSRIEILEARLEAEAKTRERFEKEMERLEGREREAMRLKVELDQVKRGASSLEDLVKTLQRDCHEARTLAHEHERNSTEAKENATTEVRRTRTLLQAEVEAANSQVNILRASLEGEISRLASELGRATRDADLQKERHDDVLHEITNAKIEAVQSAKDAAEMSLLEVHQNHEAQMENLKTEHSRALEAAMSGHEIKLANLKAEHSRALDLAVGGHGTTLDSLKTEHSRSLKVIAEDHDRAQGALAERLDLANVKSDQLQDRVSYLEEQLEIAKAAALAAAQAAQHAKTSPVAPTPEVAAVIRQAQLPEKISPQALRESIMVLQEQLQQRETHIESLEDEITKLDRDAPKKLSEKDNEIAWLRELLGVRVHELEEIAQLLSTEGYDQNSVKDAVIRLKANIEMEQQERERALAGGLVLPSLSSLSSFTTPRNVPSFAAALGSLRRGRDAAVGSLSGMVSAASETPSKSPASTFLSGLLASPAPSVRESPTPSTTINSKSKRSSGSSRSASGSSRATSGESKKKSKHKSKHLPKAEPSTPILMRESEYDLDAQAGPSLPESSPSLAVPIEQEELDDLGPVLQM